MKPQLIYKLTATRTAVEKAFGQKVGKAFIPNPAVIEYAVVMRFSDTKVIVSGELDRALRRLTKASGPVLILACDLTVEARAIAAQAGCDVLTQREFGWTDQSYQSIRQNNFN